MRPQLILSQLSSRICFKSVQDQFRFAVGGHYGMYMIGSYVERMQIPFSNATRLANRLLDGASCSCSEDKWTLLERFMVVVFPGVIGRQVGIAITVVKAID